MFLLSRLCPACSVLECLQSVVPCISGLANQQSRSTTLKSKNGASPARLWNLSLTLTILAILPNRRMRHERNASDQYAEGVAGDSTRL